MQLEFKQHPAALLFSLVFLMVTTSNVFASTYGEDKYGAEIYSRGEEEDAGCTRDHPTGDIRVISISSGDTHLKIVFEGVEGKYNEFETRWGINESLLKEESKSEVFGNRSTRSYVIEDLNPSTFYFVKVRALNGCAKGEWSAAVRGRTLDRAAAGNVKTTEIVDYTSIAATPGESSGSEEISSAPAQVLTHTLNVKVVNAAGNPVPGVSVVITALGVSAVTDYQGLVTFEKIETGWYEITTEALGIKGTQSVNVDGEGSSVIAVTIKVGSSVEKSPEKPSLVWLVGLLPLSVIVYALVRKLFAKKVLY